ncbi:MAG: NADH-quinone oxidoreductase subunit NuoH [Bryobacteraceae bacterium]
MQTLFEHPLFIPVIVILVILLGAPLGALYVGLVERKVLADFQARLGPMRVGPHGLLQPIADALKLLVKEDTIPTEADRALFWYAPCLSVFTALVALSTIPWTQKFFVADVNVGILIVSAMSSIGILGIIIGGWSSNSHYPLLGALRSAAQLVSYEVALAFALLSGVMVAGTLSMQEIVRAQMDRRVWFVFENFGLMILPFFIYLVAATAETNRTPFDLPEAESELVAGFHTEYSGLRWALFMLAEYTNMFVVSAVAVTLFWGGWLRPFPNVAWLEIPLNMGVPALLFIAAGLLCFPLSRKVKSPPHRTGLVVVGVLCILAVTPFLVPAISLAIAPLFWFFAKMFVFLYCLIWFRGTFPRFRYDQLMNIGWKRMIPLGMAALMINAVVGALR